PDDLRFRRPTLYPVELRARLCVNHAKLRRFPPTSNLVRAVQTSRILTAFSPFTTRLGTSWGQTGDNRRDSLPGRTESGSAGIEARGCDILLWRDRIRVIKISLFPGRLDQPERCDR